MTHRTCMLCEATSAGTAVTFAKKKDICDWCFSELLRKGQSWCAPGKHIAPLYLMRSCGRCKPCDAKRNKEAAKKDRRAYAKAYRKNNKEKIAAYFAREDVKARRNASRRRRYMANPELWRAHEKARYARKAAARRLAARRRYWANPAAHRAYQARRKIERKMMVLREIRGVR